MTVLRAIFHSRATPGGKICGRASLAHGIIGVSRASLSEKNGEEANRSSLERVGKFVPVKSSLTELVS